jgi:hypothetical protein
METFIPIHGTPCSAEQGVAAARSGMAGGASRSFNYLAAIPPLARDMDKGQSRWTTR